jgi:hypothetical protein
MKSDREDPKTDGERGENHRFYLLKSVVATLKWHHVPA